MNKTSISSENIAAPKAPQQQRSRETRTRILEAALTCLAELGYAEFSTMRVAKQAGVSKGAVFQHFPSKITLIIATLEYYHTKIRAQSRDRFDDNTLTLSLEERVRHFVYSCWDLMKTPEFISNNDIWAAARTNQELKLALTPLVKREQDLADLMLVLPEYSECQSLTILNNVITSTLEGMSMDYHVLGEIEGHGDTLEYLVDLGVRELEKLKQ
jgi:AcrR family transcriptional regulator